MLLLSTTTLRFTCSISKRFINSFSQSDLIRSPIAALAMQFYRRELPDTCISFSSPIGKRLFQEALAAGQMESYFKLAAQFRTQDDPAYCGLATLVMCLNSLEIDPGRVWKGPWRWFHEDMLDCCIPLNQIRKNGITLQEFTCLADCNSLHVHTVVAEDSAKFEDFEQAVLTSTATDTQILVASYSRKALKQTGDGHFAPIGGYHPGSKMCLIFDTARFKYPPHWVHLDHLWNALHYPDPTTDRPRGYSILTRSVSAVSLMVFRVSPQFSSLIFSLEDNVNEPARPMRQFVRQYEKWLSSPVANDNEQSAFYESAVKLRDLLSNTEEFILTLQDNYHHTAEVHKQFIADIFSSLKQSIEYQLLQTVFQHVTLHFKHSCNSASVNDEVLSKDPLLFVFMFILSWPFVVLENTWSQRLHGELEQIMSQYPLSLQNEIAMLRKKFNSIACKSCGLRKCDSMQPVVETSDGP